MLLVEDDAEQVRLLRSILSLAEDPAFAVITASNLDSGLRRLRASPPDVVLLDLTLPECQGEETFRRVRQARPDLPIVVLTSLEDQRLASRLLRLGAEDYLVKDSAAPDALVRSLRYAAERNRRRRMEQAMMGLQSDVLQARRVQEGLYPQHPPEVSGLDLVGMSRPADHASGDCYDFIPTPDGRVAAVVGDVSGHGLAAALLVASTRAYLRASLEEQRDPGRVLERVNRLLSGDISEERFVTLSLALLDPATGALECAVAGHPASYLLDPAGRVKATFANRSLPLGILPDTSYPTARGVTMEAGDVLIMVSDGLLETCSPDGEPFGLGRALGALFAERRRSARAIVEALFQALDGFRRGTPPRDDVTAVVVKRTTP